MNLVTVCTDVPCFVLVVGSSLVVIHCCYLEAYVLGILRIGLRLQADWGTDDEIRKIERVDEFSRHKPHLVAEVVCQLMDSLQA